MAATNYWRSFNLDGVRFQFAARFDDDTGEPLLEKLFIEKTDHEGRPYWAEIDLDRDIDTFKEAVRTAAHGPLDDDQSGTI